MKFEEVEMRGLSLLLLGASLASCTMASPGPEAVTSTPSGQRAATALLTGKVPGRPMSCLPNYSANDMTVLDSRTIAFRQGTATTYLVHLTPGCELAGAGPYALVSRQVGGMGLCQGDIQEVMDTLNHMTVGSCTIAGIVPYVRPGH
jgi:hypothetical protein